MPQRTNDFQQLVYLIQVAAQPVGAVVEESKLLTDATTGTEREVDIVVTVSTGGVPMMLGIECVNHNRPKSVTWVESMIAKHQHLPTTSLVLVSRSGFYKPALKKAEKIGIVTCSLDEATDADWNDFITRWSQQQLSMVMIIPESVTVHPSPSYQGAPILRALDLDQDLIQNTLTNQSASVRKFVDDLTESPAVKQNLFFTFRPDLRMGTTWKAGLAHTPKPRLLELRCYDTGISFPIQKLDIHFAMACTGTEFALQGCEFLGQRVAYGSVPSGDGSGADIGKIIINEGGRSVLGLNMPEGMEILDLNVIMPRRD